MANALKWAGYFAIITGVIIAINLIFSLRMIDSDYRWYYAVFVLAVTIPIGLMSVAVSQFIESKSGDYTFDARKRREEMNRS
ncbi:hypothetical protein ACIFOT_28895 [Neobacillus sp. NRS-1170]|uniref:hypothetical protein n=1 Tax=Neobacillus sp. NRS-1170 TaxID=3233898 RepID=UPI003D2DF80B